MLVLKANSPLLPNAVKEIRYRLNEDLSIGNVCVVPYYLDVVCNTENDVIVIENSDETKRIIISNWIDDRTPDTGRKVLAVVETNDGERTPIIASFFNGRWHQCGINVVIAFTNAVVVKWRELGRNYER